MLSSPLPPLITTLVLLWPVRRRLMGTTLVAPWAWALVAAVAWIALELWLIAGGSDQAEALRYLVVAGTFCPMMAVMGAKRPQDRGWQWIVLSLWLVLAIPVGQHLLFSRGQPFSVFAAWPLFLAVLLALELLNYLPTRHAFSVLLLTAAQCLLLGDALGWQPLATHGSAWAACFAFAAVAAGWLASFLSPVPCPLTPDAHWLEFRNSFGAFWALRVLQRVNQTAELQDWPVRLQWSGFHQLPGRPDPPSEEAIDQCLRTLLRRFVVEPPPPEGES